MQPQSGPPEGAERGDNPTKPGRRSFHPLLAVIAGTRLCPAYRFRSGDTVRATQWQAAMSDAQRWLGPQKVWLNRGDLGLGHEAVKRWHETGDGRPEDLCKLKLSPGVRRQALAVPEAAWPGPATVGAWPVAEVKRRLFGWTAERRVVLARCRQGEVSAAHAGTFWDECRHEDAAYVTSLAQERCNAWQIMALDRQRADTENVFDELKNPWGFSGFCARKRAITELAARRLQRGRQKELQLALSGGWLEKPKDGYRRLHEWIHSTAPQLKTATTTTAPSTPVCA